GLGPELPTALDAEVPVLPGVGDLQEPAPIFVASGVPKPTVPSLDMDALFGDLATDSMSAPDDGLSLASELASGSALDLGTPPLGELTSLEGELGVEAEMALFGDLTDEPPPALPLSDDEPPAVPAIALQEIQPDLQMIDTLKRIAGPGGDPERARSALVAALKGESYDPRELPDARVIAAGTARALVANGFPIDNLVAAIMDVLGE
ncbi:MAG: hypothetical protein AAB426_12820, partial [Myxococcota bacterium]